MKGDSPTKEQQHKSILKSEAISPGNKRVHFNDDSGKAQAGETEDGAESEEKNMEQLMAAAESAAEPAPDDKDASTITIFNESGEVRDAPYS